MTFDPPKVKKPKTVYRYEAEAKALVGKVFADGNRIGKVRVSLKFDIPEQMMLMLVSDISKAVEHWSSRIIVNSHNK